jgi:hypothetical protein
LIAFQVCFDLCENDNQKFLGRLLSLLPVNPASEAGAVPTGRNALHRCTNASCLVIRPRAREMLIRHSGNPTWGLLFSESVAVPADATPALWPALDTVRSILDGTKTFELNLDFLFRHNKTDPLLLLQLKAATEGAPTSADNRSSVLHNAAIVAHGFMACGTTFGFFCACLLVGCLACVRCSQHPWLSGCGTPAILHRCHPLLPQARPTTPSCVITCSGWGRPPHGLAFPPSHRR